MKTLAEWSEEIKELVDNHFKRWITWKTTPKALMYIVTECAEAMEAWRDDDREHFGEELADIFIRLLDLADELKYDLDAEVERKMATNWKRQWEHGRTNVD